MQKRFRVATSLVEFILQQKDRELKQLDAADTETIVHKVKFNTRFSLCTSQKYDRKKRRIFTCRTRQKWNTINIEPGQQHKYDQCM